MTRRRHVQPLGVHVAFVPFGQRDSGDGQLWVSWRILDPPAGVQQGYGYYWLHEGRLTAVQQILELPTLVQAEIWLSVADIDAARQAGQP